MSTPTINTVPTTAFVAAAGNDGALQYGVKWGGLYGTGVALTYSFPSGTGWYIDPYGDGEFGSWYSLTSAEKIGGAAALAEWASVANITFTEVNDGKSVVGDLRFAVTDNAYDESAHAYLPDDNPEGGDVWFLNGEWHKKPNCDDQEGVLRLPHHPSRDRPRHRARAFLRAAAADRERLRQLRLHHHVLLGDSRAAATTTRASTRRRRCTSTW